MFHTVHGCDDTATVNVRQHIALYMPLWVSTRALLNVAAVCFVSNLSKRCAHSLRFLTCNQHFHFLFHLFARRPTAKNSLVVDKACIRFRVLALPVALSLLLVFDFPRSENCFPVPDWFPSGLPALLLHSPIKSRRITPRTDLCSVCFDFLLRRCRSARKRGGRRRRKSILIFLFFLIFL